MKPTKRDLTDAAMILTTLFDEYEKEWPGSHARLDNFMDWLRTYAVPTQEPQSEA